MDKCIRLFGFALVVFLPCFVTAQEKTAEKIEKLRLEIIDLQNKGEQGVRNLCFCTGVRSFGGYDKMKSNKLPKSVPFLIYYEPENLFTKVENEKYNIDFVQDFVLMSPDGKKELFRRNEMIKMQMTTDKPLLDIYVTNNVDLTGLSPGKYIVKGVVHDRNRKGSKPFEWKLDFELVDQ